MLVNHIINIKSFNNYVDSELYNKSNTTDEKNQFFYKNIEDKENIFIYKYHYIAELSTKGYKKNYFTTNNKDIYYNELSYMINNYLIFPQYTEDDLIDGFKIIDVIKNTHSYFNFDHPSSKTLYVQGIVDNKLYLVNRTDDTQYVIDPYKSVMEKIEAKYFDGKNWSNRNINDFISNKVLFPVRRYKALNEVFLTRDTIKRNIVASEIYVNDKFLGKFKGDGVIISTPTGSTAYSLSAGGPIVTPEQKLFIITPIAPHNLNTRPIILSGDVKLVLTLSEPSQLGLVNIDGHTHKTIKLEDKVEIFYSKESLKIVIPEARNYYDVLREKLKWGENLC